MQFKPLKLSDQSLFEQFFKLGEYNLSAYHFANIFIWKKLFQISYIILDGYLCLFFKDRNSCFMYLPPLGRELNLSVINACFKIMDRLNSHKAMSRIENVPEDNLVTYQEYGYTYSVKPGDYLYNRDEIIFLQGNRFKSKRAGYNHFVKHNNFEFRSFLKQDIDECLALYQTWADQRKGKFSDRLYQAMLEDNYSSLKLALENSLSLCLTGYVIRIKDKLAAYTFGFPINAKTFCILFEICDLSYRGISQFIFSHFCRQLKAYPYINVMDDSGLVNLSRVKLSYRPLRIIANYIIKQKYA
ncbi:MAG: phosphatidylglycerol lysyltransferase domain-containing protein [Candidatus Omnitrophota bacterium]